jgi:hypothetical protein
MELPGRPSTLIGLATIDRMPKARSASACGSGRPRHTSSSTRAGRPVRHTTAGDRSQAVNELTPSESELAIFPAVPAAPERTLVDVFESTVARHPDAPALDDGRAALDYRTLRTEVYSLAARLHRVGIGAGDRVGVRVPSGTADLYVAILGVLSAGVLRVNGLPPGGPDSVRSPGGLSRRVMTRPGWSGCRR